MKQLLIIILLFTGYCATAQTLPPVITRVVLGKDTITTPPLGVTRVVLTLSAIAAPAGVTKATLLTDSLPVTFMYFFPFKLN